MDLEGITKLLGDAYQENDEQAIKAINMIFEKQESETKGLSADTNPGLLTLLLLMEVKKLNRQIVKLEYKLNNIININTICGAQIVGNTSKENDT